MNICKSNIYFILLLGIIIYLFFFNNNDNKIENFQSTTTGYTSDIEALRNLSSIASQLLVGGNLTIPGSLNVKNNLTVKTSNPAKQILFGEGEIKFRGDKFAHYSIINNNGNFKISNTSNAGTLNSGFVNDVLVSDSSGNITTPYMISCNGTINSQLGLKTKGGNNGQLTDNTTYFPNSDGINYIRGDTIVDCSNITISGNVTLNNNIFISNNKITKSHVAGTFVYTGTDNGSTYKPVTPTMLFLISPYYTISGNNIKFNYSGTYCIIVNFYITGFSSCSGSNKEVSGYFALTDTNGNIPTVIYNQTVTYYKDSTDTSNIIIKNYTTTDYKCTVRITTNCTTTCTNNNNLEIIFMPTVGTNYNFSTKTLQIKTGSFLIYKLN